MARAGGGASSNSELYEVAPGVPRYLLRLYVAGSNLKSAQAIQTVRALCSSFPRGRCRLEVVDLYQQPGLARADNIVAVPSLLKLQPPPRRAFIGITDDTDRILHKLGIPITKYGSQKKQKR